MKKQALLRIVGIGIFHAVLYLYIVPFIIVPQFGHNGLILSVIIAVVISISVFGTLFLNKKKENKGDKDD